MTDLKLTAFRLLADECARQEHSLCNGTGECAELEAAYEMSQERRVRAAQFDAGHERLSLAKQQPGHSWGTAALLRTVKDLILTPPSNDGLWRSITITTALARLGERGLPADAIVRTGVANELVERILRDTAFYWCAARGGHIAASSVPQTLRPWCDILDQEAVLTDMEDPLPHDVGSWALAGAPGIKARKWVETAAVGHIVDWRIDNYLQVGRSPEDFVLAGGKDSTKWVYDRFTKTYPREWRVPSLTWELVYNNDPTMVARFVGVPDSVLAERVVTDDMLTNSIQAKLTAFKASEEVEGFVDAGAAITSLGLMLDQGLIEGARAMARKLHEAYPRQWYFGMAYAFCTIPYNAAEARSILSTLDVGSDVVGEALRTVNLATCSLIQGDHDMAYAIVSELVDRTGDRTMWLWDPKPALQGRASILFGPIAAWLDRLAACRNG